MRISVIFLLHTLFLISCPACGEKRDTLLEGGGTNRSAGPPVTRSEIILTADAYARIHWTMSAINRTGISCGAYFISNYPEGNRIGVGYKWGGWNDIDDFLQKIEEGYGTGTGGGMNTYEHFSSDCVVGVSCTGFVSRAWHLYQKYTLCYQVPDIPRKLCEISRPVEGVDLGSHQVDALQKGDAFINDFHTILFVYETRDGDPMVMDSSFPGVRFRRLTWSHLASEGYRAIRYVNIREVGNPPGTIAKPLKIQSDRFPFIHEGNTRDVVGMEFDRYSASPAISQVGPEVMYELLMRCPGTVTMTVTDVPHEGINNDIHLLGSLERSDAEMMAVDCIERADNTITRELDNGFYYIIIDSSMDLPGEYTLSVDFN